MDKTSNNGASLCAKTKLSSNQYRKDGSIQTQVSADNENDISDKAD